MAKKEADSATTTFPEKMEDIFRKMEDIRKEAVPQLTEFAEHFIRLRGGPVAVARMLSEEWDNAPRGGVVRSRIMDLLLRVWKIVDTKSLSREELELVSTEDLERMFGQMMTDLHPSVETVEKKPGGRGRGRPKAEKPETKDASKEEESRAAAF